MDHLLYQTDGPKLNVFWRPGNGRAIAPQHPEYRPFSQIVRTVHIHEALEYCMQHRLQPKHIFNNSILSRRSLKNTDHPCKNIQVLWFGAESPPGQDEEHDWYGNIQFSIPVDFLLRRWKHRYLVEMATSKTRTATHVLITNKDYSGVLPRYDPHQRGGSWYIENNCHSVLVDCVRFNDEGSNYNGHFLEFMIEVSPEDQRELLNICEISFKNHAEVRNIRRKLRCYRTQFINKVCPWPLPSAVASRVFFDQHQRLNNEFPIAKPQLSQKAEYYRQCYYLSNNPSPLCETLSLPTPMPSPQPTQRHSPQPTLQVRESFLHSHIPLPGPLTWSSLQSFSVQFYQQIGSDSTFFKYQSTYCQSWGTSREQLRQSTSGWWWSMNDTCRFMTWHCNQQNYKDSLFVSGGPVPQKHRKRNKNKNKTKMIKTPDRI